MAAIDGKPLSNSVSQRAIAWSRSGRGRSPSSLCHMIQPSGSSDRPTAANRPTIRVLNSPKATFGFIEAAAELIGLSVPSIGFINSGVVRGDAVLDGVDRTALS